MTLVAFTARHKPPLQFVKRLIPVQYRKLPKLHDKIAKIEKVEEEEDFA